jgi:putative transferase (TIGR04331 family)
VKLLSASGLEKKFKRRTEELLPVGSWVDQNEYRNFGLTQNLDYLFLEKKYKIRTYIPNLRKKLIKTLSLNLNKFHNKNFSEKYWTMLIDPWLSYYLIQNFYRWVVVKELLKKNKFVRCLYFNNINYDPLFNDDEFLYFIINSKNYNQFIFQRIYKYQKKIKPSLVVTNINNFITNDKTKFEIKSEGNLIKKFFFYLLSFFCSENHFFLDFKLSKINFFKLNLKLGQIPFKGTQIFSRENLNKIFSMKKKINKKKREKFHFLKTQDVFEKFITKYLANDIPSSLIEKYFEIDNQVDQISLKPSLIYSDTEYMHNTLFKFWLAKMTIKKIPFYTGQHGGYWGNNRQPIHFNDVFTKNNIKWHARIRKNNTQIPVPYLIPFLDKRLNNNKSKSILFIGINTTQFPSYIGTGPMSNEIFDQVKKIKKFTNKIEVEGKDLYFRPYKGARYWKIEKELKKNANLKIVESDKLYRKLFNKTKLIVTTHPRTAFLEALISGPTIIILNEKYYLEEGKLLKAMKELKKAKIMFSHSEQAAEHLNKVWPNIDNWWKNKKVKKARENFISTVSPTNKDSLNEWIKFFKNEYKEIND